MLVVDNACAVEMFEGAEKNKQQQVCLTQNQSNMWMPWTGH